MMEKYSSASKMAPQSSGSLRSNAGIEKGKEIAARLNIHRIHSQLRGLDSSGTHAQIYIHMYIYYTVFENTLIGQLLHFAVKYFCMITSFTLSLLGLAVFLEVILIIIKQISQYYH